MEINKMTYKTEFASTVLPDGKESHLNFETDGGMLGILAEVASVTVRNKTILSNKTVSKEPNSLKTQFETGSCRELTMQRLQSFSASQLVHHFATKDFDEIKRNFSFTCHFAEHCKRTFKSFGSEKRAEQEIKKHLKDHLQELRKATGKQFFTAKSVQKPKRSKVPRILDHDYCDQYKSPSKEPDTVAPISLDDWTALFGSARNDVSYKIHCRNFVLDNFMQDELINTVKAVHPKNKSIALEQSVPVVGCEIEVEYNPAEFLLMRSSELPVIQDNRTNRAASKPEQLQKLPFSSGDTLTVPNDPTLTHRKQTIFTCLDCKKRFFNACHYEEHRQKHVREGVKSYICGECSGSFTRQHSLNYHLLIHSNQSRFTCPDCNKQFRHPSHYKEHRRRHTGEAPYLCSDCNKRYRARNSYKRHLIAVHGKVLTTAGSLIILSDEEFAKLKKKHRKSHKRT